MLVLFMLYGAIGVGVVVTTLIVKRYRRTIDRTALKVGMTVRRGRLAWIVGTIVAWPLGLFVLATGRLFLVDEHPENAGHPEPGAAFGMGASTGQAGGDAGPGDLSSPDCCRR